MVFKLQISDLMRRMVKENLLKFDATPLFPERIATTVPYKLFDAEARLCREVTDYVRETSCLTTTAARSPSRACAAGYSSASSYSS